MDIVKRVTKIEFSPINPDEFKKYSVCEIKTSDLYDKNKEPKYNGLNDPRLGPVNNHVLCDTCGKDAFHCQGHFGHLNLKIPVYNPIFLKKVVLLLNITCFSCFNLLIDKTNTKFLNIIRTTKKNKRINLIYKTNVFQKISSCNTCSAKVNQKITKDGMLLISTTIENEKKVKKKFYANDALKILEKMKDNDIILLGMSPLHSRPEWLLFHTYPVIPPCVRPSISFGCNLRCEDDLVYKLVKLIKANKSLGNKMISDNKKYIEVYEEQLQWSTTTLIDNNIKTIPQSLHRNNGRPLKSFKDRIKGKEGRIRGNILGKRVNYSGRTVIGPDPCIKIDEVGIPYKICKILTFPEVVNRYNYKKLEKLVENGPNVYPGANYIIKNYNSDNEITSDLKYRKKENPIKLCFGDIVRRHLDTSDHVLFNRQPSLHKMSMMGHRVHPIKGKSFRLNPSVTKPYNADKNHCLQQQA